MFERPWYICDLDGALTLKMEPSNGFRDMHAAYEMVGRRGVLARIWKLLCSRSTGTARTISIITSESLLMMRKCHFKPVALTCNLFGERSYFLPPGHTNHIPESRLAQPIGIPRMHVRDCRLRRRDCGFTSGTSDIMLDKPGIV